VTNSPTPQGVQEATDGYESAPEAESEDRDVQPATDAAEGRTEDSDLRARLDAVLAVRDAELQQLREQVALVAGYADAWYQSGTGSTRECGRTILAALRPQEEPAVNPPGSTREQLPADLLALIDAPPYVSTACQTAAACEKAYEGNPRWFGLLQHAEQLHNRCRENQKFTGQLCACDHHRDPS